MNKEIRIPANAIQAAMLCRATDDPRPYLEGVYISPKLICGTNGHVLYACRLDKKIEGLDEPILVNLNKKIPASADYCRLLMGEKHPIIESWPESAGGKRLAIDVAETNSHIKNWPTAGIEKLLALADEEPQPIAKMCIDFRYLILAEKIFAGIICKKWGNAELRFTGEHSALSVCRKDTDRNTHILLIMPMRR